MENDEVSDFVPYIDFLKLKNLFKKEMRWVRNRN